ncbi:conserved Plasmodium protein, unknown function [Plasmodium knowlesi strain H]|uniref:Uncharacterized protein n=3 Tax=Plasmodium knowlesi TaxID=5850 RepID=A0A5K1VQ68_PLAKH|nr:conserved protein, unknown function [Plasmodium knowlesi strain H]OTN68367.1 Uncharacterized protein PKNOH_S03329900 [Plasmodium knowlesi]CAA9987201.1 conserved protein, unknown function [Plasmodium knowlesi strain H]SBO23965.1 conserved Plasmodium protein, unknown function [Plasmodium knowlesi strain H]SBO25921.1 conserved Plasmodium protein, unknown function [Plasmodium knowlesi strain H]VVS76675.1 conserved protein, unknown function [Plasmodium knowlesi strain H]|eukprot:XP_002261822.1 hypothetical protein, conserved in Plasmodium species [Plasmodium knowlesi strain H]
MDRGIILPSGRVTCLKRSKKQIESLQYSLKKNIRKNEELTNRVHYFFPTDDVLDKTLFHLCKFIPSDMDILDEDKQMERTYNSTPFSRFEKSDTDSWSDKIREDDDIEIEEPRDRRSQLPSLSPKLGIKKRETHSCVEWKGFVNEANGYAVVKILNPFSSQEYSTYTNRLVYFLFQRTNYLGVEDFLRNHNFVRMGIPLYMKCKNKLCVRLSHIDASNDLYV